MKKLLLLLLLSFGFICTSYAGEVDTNISKLKASNACVSCNLNRTYLSKANLKEADLNRAILNYANLSEASLYRANLSGANLSGANLSGASLSSANLSEVKLCRTIMPNGFSDNSGC